MRDTRSWEEGREGFGGSGATRGTAGHGPGRAEMGEPAWLWPWAPALCTVASSGSCGAPIRGVEPPLTSLTLGPFSSSSLASSSLDLCLVLMLLFVPDFVVLLGRSFLSPQRNTGNHK